MKRLIGIILLALALPASVGSAGNPLPDLVVVDQGYGAVPYIVTQDFPANGGDCAVQEGAIDAGIHKLLRFQTFTVNYGLGDAKLGRPRQNDPNWVFYTCHDHWHFVNYADYRLVDAAGNVVGVGHKQSFCVEDTTPWVVGLFKSYRPAYTCDRQGLSSGWGDDYSSGLTGQWVVIDNVPPGDYTLEQTVNPLHVITESDYSNNTLRTPVTIP